MLTVQHARDVQNDLLTAAQWYIKQQPELGERFLQDFRATAGLIARVGRACRNVTHDYRRVNFRQYPYVAYFVVYGDAAVIYLVIHTSRDPALVDRLLKDRR